MPRAWRGQASHAGGAVLVTRHPAAAPLPRGRWPRGVSPGSRARAARRGDDAVCPRATHATARARQGQGRAPGYHELRSSASPRDIVAASPRIRVSSQPRIPVTRNAVTDAALAEPRNREHPLDVRAPVRYPSKTVHVHAAVQVVMPGRTMSPADDSLGPAPSSSDWKGHLEIRLGDLPGRATGADGVPHRHRQGAGRSSRSTTTRSPAPRGALRDPFGRWWIRDLGSTNGTARQRRADQREGAEAGRSHREAIRN